MMRLWHKFKRSLDRKRRLKELREEEKLTQEVIQENEKAAEEAREESGIPAAVITYIPAPDEEGGPRMDVLVEEMTCRLMPEPGSIIWIAAGEGVSRPFKVVRFDYVENGSEFDSMRVYIVTEPAFSSDIVPNPHYLMEFNV
jgi:hypothetical protein